MIFRKLSFYLAVAGVVAALFLVHRMKQRPPSPGPESPPARSPYDDTVAATGLVEAARENVKIASPRSGLVTQVAVHVGDRVKSGDLLFKLDDRETRARVAAMEAQLELMQANLAVEEVTTADWTDQVDRFSKLERDKVATEDELKRRQFNLQGSKARLNSTRASIASARRQLDQARTDLEILSVKAPRDGQLLQVNVREGEFAPAAAMTGDPLMLLGDVDHLQVRAEVDEQNAILVDAHQPAQASLKGHADLRMPLRFVRIEPYVVPKRSLTGDSLERVDTRVLQIVFEFDRPAFAVYVGQQVDVFIARAAGGGIAPGENPAVSLPKSAATR
jgi:RND family efflux transporter MFP subunit